MVLLSKGKSNLALLATGPVALYVINERQIAVGNTDFKLVFPAAAGWSGPSESEDDWMPQYEGALNKKQHYIKAGGKIYLYTGYYQVQAENKELIAYHNQISDPEVWRPTYTRARDVLVDEREVLEQLLINKQGQQRLVWYWYNVGGRLTANKYEAKMLQVLGLLTGDTGSYIIAVAADKVADIEVTKKMMSNFILSMPVPQVVLLNSQ